MCVSVQSMCVANVCERVPMRVSMLQSMSVCSQCA